MIGDMERLLAMLALAFVVVAILHFTVVVVGGL